jgi:hypothetical protein
VILTSAYYSIVDNNLNFEFVEKPFTLQNLLDKVNFYLEDDNPTVHHYQRGKEEIC